MKAVWGVALAGVLACASAGAADDKASEATAGQEGMRAYVDPETGALTSKRPEGTPEPALEQGMEAIEKIEHPNGMTEWKFHGQMQEAVVATVNPDGTVATECSDALEHVGQPHGAAKKDDRHE